MRPQILQIASLWLLIIAIAHGSSVHRRFRRAVSAEQELQLAAYLRGTFEQQTTAISTKQVIAEWNFATDVSNKEKQAAQNKANLEAANYTKTVWEQHFKGLNYKEFHDPVIQREIRALSVLGTAALDEASLRKLNDVGSSMTNIYSTAKICPYTKQNCDIKTEGMSLDPDIEGFVQNSTDYEELKYIWKSWRDASGAKMKELYKTYVELSNKAAKLNGFHDLGEYWRRDYESDTFVDDMDKLWDQVRPLYDELHTYVLHKLHERYPNIDVKDGLIPAHVLGNMWAQSWSNIYDLVKPFPNASSVDVTKALQEQGYTPLKMFQTSDEFYRSLGLEPNDMSYNVSTGAVITKPPDREILCHASAWDFQNGKDYRIKMCTKVNMEDFITIHHEMGHIQYFILYKNQPITLRTGANPGFHEAVGDTIALSVSTPNHLQKIGLLKDYTETEESNLNALMLMALERVAFLPFGLLIDRWRWDVFSGNVTEAEWNKRWWHYRETIQKVKAPVPRTENDFDPGAKYHIPGNSQYIAYFVAHILEFQLHRSLCITAKEYNPNDNTSKPLHQCDIYQSKEAGAKLRAGLSLGASRHWSEALKEMTGETQLSGDALIEYFKPLHEFLRQQNLERATNTSAQAEECDNCEGGEDGTAEDQTVPIIVGSVIGAIVVICIIVYLIKRK